MKQFSLFLFASGFCGMLSAQTVFNFSTDPVSDGWTYYDETVNSNSIIFNQSDEALNYNITSTVETAILHTALPTVSLNDNYCISFKITPSSSSNNNTFFPMLLAATEQSGPDFHPWRKNPLNQFTAGDLQDLNLIGVSITDNELKFLHRVGNVMDGNTMKAFTNPMILTADVSYWVKLTVTNGTTANLSVYSDSDMTSELQNQDITIPNLGSMTHLYITNCNGNSNTDQQGALDDYVLNDCFLSLTQQVKFDQAIELFPNPSSTYVNILFPENHDIESIQLLDANQRVLRSQQINPEMKQTTFEDLNLSTGVYTVLIICPNSRYNRRLVLVN